MNNCSFVGRVGRDAVVRYTQGGKAVTGWALAVDRGWGDQKQTVWLDCSWWGDRGTKVADFIKKGDRLAVTGELGTREHEGKVHVTLDVRDVTLLGGKPAQESKSQRPAPKGRPNPPDSYEDFDSDSIPF